MTNTLFIHLGPGGNCEIERKWFTSRYPHIDFWDQGPAKSFSELYKNLEKKLLESGRTKLIAHSFGCELAKELIKNHSDKIESATLLAPCPRLPESFFRLANKLSNDRDTPSDIQKELREILDLSPKPSKELMWELVVACSKDPSHPRLFFFDKEIMGQYFSDAATATPMDTETWQSVISDFLTTVDVTLPLDKQTPIKIYLGKEDPYSEPQEDKSFLEKVYPAAKVEILEKCGHLLHFEQDKATLS